MRGNADVRTARVTWECEGECSQGFIVQYYPVAERRLTINFSTNELFANLEHLFPKTKYAIEVVSTDEPTRKAVLFTETSPVTVSDLECKPEFMRVFVHTGDGFQGVIYVDTHYDDCVVRGPNPAGDGMFVVDIDISKCAYDKSNFTWEAVLITQEDPRITTAEDTALLITCEYPPNEEKKVLTAELELTGVAPDGQFIDESNFIIQPLQSAFDHVETELKSALLQSNQNAIEQEDLKGGLTFTTADFVIISLVGFIIITAILVAVAWYRWRLRVMKRTEKLAAVNDVVINTHTRPTDLFFIETPSTHTLA